MPDVKVFIDANVFLYARQEARDTKTEKAERWLSELGRAGAACANLQVINEVANVLLRKRRDLTASEIFDACDSLLPLGSTALTPETIRQGRRLYLDTRYSWWDCLLLASAVELGCTHFLSEDLKDEHRLGSLTILSPFAHSPREILA